MKVGSSLNSNLTAPQAHRAVYFFVISMVPFPSRERSVCGDDHHLLVDKFLDPGFLVCPLPNANHASVGRTRQASDGLDPPGRPPKKPVVCLRPAERLTAAQC